MAESSPRSAARFPSFGRGAPYALALTVVASALAVGTVHAEVLLVVAAVTALHVSWAAPRRWPLPALVSAALSAMCLIQLVPVPLSWLKVVSPRAADLWSRALDVTSSPGHAAPVSLDPPATALEAVKWLVYAAVVALSARIAVRHGVRSVAMILFGSGVTVATVTVVHALVDAQRVFGVYEPVFATGPAHVGPLLNPNNLAGYMNLCLLSGLGLLLHRNPVLPRWALGIGVALMLGVSMRSGSRAGMVALGGGLIAVALLARQLQSSDPSRRRSPGRWLALPAVLGAGLAVLGATGKTWSDLSDTDVSKLDLMQWSLAPIWDFRWLGTGRGALATVLQGYGRAQHNLIATNPENFVLTWTLEWGVAVAVIALAALAWWLRPKTLALGPHPGAWCLWLAVLCVAGQNLFDLGLELPALCIAVAAALGGLSGHRQRASARSAPVLSSAGMRAVCALGVALTLGAAISSTAWRGAAKERAALSAAYRSAKPTDRTAAASLGEAVEIAVARHPADPFLFRLGALVAMRRERDPMPWLTRALERGMTQGRTYLVLALALGRRGATDQALLALRQAIEHDPELMAVAARRALDLSQDPERLARAAPSGSGGARFLVRAASLVRNPAQAPLKQRLLGLAIERDPSSTQPRSLWVLGRIADLQARRAPCEDTERVACRKRIDAELAHIERLGAERWTVLELRARFLLASGKTHDALARLRAGCGSLGPADAMRCFELQARVAAEARDREALKDAAKRLIGACSTLERCARAHRSVGDQMMRIRAYGDAAHHYARAAEILPSDHGWLKLADASLRAGAPARAAVALRRARASKQRTALLRRAKAALHRDLSLHLSDR
jgi:tetratricopeptide (TPR) repeat protein